MANFFATYPSTVSSGSNASVGANGVTSPTSSTLVAGQNPTGNQQPLQTDSSGNLLVNIASPASPSSVNLAQVGGTAVSLGQKVMASSLPIVIASDQSAVPVSAASLPLPTGASTSALQTTGNTSLASIDAKLTNPLPVSGTVTANQGTSPWVVSGTVAATQSGAWTTGRTWTLSSGTDSVSAVVSSSALPTGAATSANQTNGSQLTQIVDGSGNVWGPRTGSGGVNWMPVINLEASADGSAIAARTLQIGGSDGTNLRNISVDSTGKLNINNISGTISLPTGAATAANQATEISSLSTIASNTGKVPASTAGSGSAAGATVSTVITLTAPANAVGFVLMNLDVSTTNMRWAVGRTATTTLGQQLQPGRDTGFFPVDHDVSIVAESGTCTYDVQWVSSS